MNYLNKKEEQNKKPLRNFVVCGLLLALMLILSFSSARSENQIIDESAHIVSGFSYWKTGIWHLNREHPPLIKLIATFPLLFTKAELNTNTASWISGDQWNMGHDFLYNNKISADTILLLTRIPMMLIALVLGWLIWMWSKKLFGFWGAVFSLTLYVLDPNILAHSRYVTTDIGSALGFALSLYCLWRYLQTPTTRNLFFTGAAFGLAIVTKFSTVLLIPFFLIFSIIFIIFYVPRRHKLDFTLRRTWQLLAATLGGALAFITLTYALALPHISANLQLISEFKEYSGITLPFYHIFLDGLFFVIGHSAGGHYSYLLVNFDIHGGWWYYFPIAFLIKTPPATLIIFGLTILLLITQWTKTFIHRLNTQPNSRAAKTRLLHRIPSIPFHYVILIGTPDIYMIASILNSINIGWRHLLPMYPFLFIAAGKLPTLAQRIPQTAGKTYRIWKYTWAATLSGFVLILAVSSFTAYPGYLSYFSERIGGSTEGYKYMLDSNIDWGQDIKRLSNYIKKKQHQNSIPGRIRTGAG